MATTTKYKVNWDNGSEACGTFPNVFDTEEDAQAFADNWVDEMSATLTPQEREGLEDDQGYSAEVIEVESEPEHDEEEGLCPEFWC